MLLPLAALCSILPIVTPPVLRAPAGLSARYSLDATITTTPAQGDPRTLTQRAVVSLIESKPDADGTSAIAGAVESLTAELSEEGSTIAFRFAPGDAADDDEPEFARALRAVATTGFSLTRFEGQLLATEPAPPRRGQPPAPERPRFLGVLAPSALHATFAPVVALDPAGTPRQTGDSWIIERRLANGVSLRITPAIESIDGQRVVVRGPVAMTARAPEPGSAEPAIQVSVSAGEFRAVWTGDRLETSELRYDAAWTARAATDPPVERSTTTSTRITLTLVRDP